MSVRLRETWKCIIKCLTVNIIKRSDKTVKGSTANSIVKPCCEKPVIKSDMQTCRRVTDTPFTSEWTFYNKPDCFMECLLWPARLNVRSFTICVHLICLPLNDQIRDFKVELQTLLTTCQDIWIFFFPLSHGHPTVHFSTGHVWNFLSASVLFLVGN